MSYFYGDSEVNMPHFICSLTIYKFCSSIFLDKMFIENVYWSMELNPMHKLPMILCSDFVANLAIFWRFYVHGKTRSGEFYLAEIIILMYMRVAKYQLE